MKQVRQGDVFLVKGVKLPEGAKKKDNTLIVEGEATNHAHYAVGCEVYELDEMMYVVTPKDVTDSEIALKHLLMTTGLWTGEHTEIALEPNTTYEVRIQKAYDPYRKAIERNAD
jgi:hypothetical protein